VTSRPRALALLAAVAALAVTLPAACAGTRASRRFDPRHAIAALAAGDWHLCGLRVDGSVSCVQVESVEGGESLAAPPADVAAGTPLPVPPEFAELHAIAAGRDRTCGLRHDGTIVCIQHSTRATTVAPGEVNDALALGLGSMHASVVRPDHVVEVYDLRDGLLAHQTRRTAEGHLELEEEPTAADLGSRFGCASTSDGHAYCWGSNWGGECGNGGDGLELDPVAVVPALAADSPEVARAFDGCEPTCDGRLEGVARVIARSRTACALLAERGVACWGESTGGVFLPESQNPDFSRRPVLIAGTEGATDVCLGLDHICVLRDGAVACRGSIVTSDVLTTVPGLERISEIACTAHAVCGRTRRGETRCFGENGAGTVEMR